MAKIQSEEHFDRPNRHFKPVSGITNHSLSNLFGSWLTPYEAFSPSF